MMRNIGIRPKPAHYSIGVRLVEKNLLFITNVVVKLVPTLYKWVESALLYE